MMSRSVLRYIDKIANGRLAEWGDSQIESGALIDNEQPRMIWLRHGSEGFQQ
jgi:hypothetical protein